MSLLAGVAIFPAVFSFVLQPDAGPSLLFIAIPAVFAGVPFGQLFLTLFFVLVAIAATGAMLSLMEVPVAALSSSLMADVHVLGMTFFDLRDAVTASLLLPLGGLAISLFAGWDWGDGLRRALFGNGVIGSKWLSSCLLWLLRVVTPLLVFVVLLQVLGVI